MDRRDFLKLAVFGALGLTLAPVDVQSALIPLQPTIGNLTLKKGMTFSYGVGGIVEDDKLPVAVVTDVKGRTLTFESLR